MPTKKSAKPTTPSANDDITQAISSRTGIDFSKGPVSMTSSEMLALVRGEKFEPPPPPPSLEDTVNRLETELDAVRCDVQDLLDAVYELKEELAQKIQSCEDRLRDLEEEEHSD